MCISSIITISGSLAAIVSLFWEIIKERTAVFRTPKTTTINSGYSPFGDTGEAVLNIRFFNAGKSDAKDVRIVMSPPHPGNEIEEKNFQKFISENECELYYELIGSNSYMEERIYVPWDIKILNIKITWNDGLFWKRSKSFSVNL